MDFVKYEELCVLAGIDPDRFWFNTMRTNTLLLNHLHRKEEEQWKLVRQIEFANYNSTLLIPPMGGKMIEPFKNIKKPQDLYTFPSEEIQKKNSNAVYDPERAISAFNNTEKDKTKWLMKN